MALPKPPLWVPIFSLRHPKAVKAWRIMCVLSGGCAVVTAGDGSPHSGRRLCDPESIIRLVSLGNSKLQSYGGVKLSGFTRSAPNRPHSFVRGHIS